MSNRYATKRKLTALGICKQEDVLSTTRDIDFRLIFVIAVAITTALLIVFDRISIIALASFFTTLKTVCFQCIETPNTVA